MYDNALNFYQFTVGSLNLIYHTIVYERQKTNLSRSYEKDTSTNQRSYRHLFSRFFQKAESLDPLPLSPHLWDLLLMVTKTEWAQRVTN